MEKMPSSHTGMTSFRHFFPHLCICYLRDPRQPAAPLRMHGSTHSDDITTLTFCPEKEFATGRNIILSGSTDGLLSTSYADEDDEDESTIQVGNLGTSISQAGWVYGAVEDTSQAAIWAATDMETFSTWTNEVFLFYRFANL